MGARPTPINIYAPDGRAITGIDSFRGPVFAASNLVHPQIQ